VNLAGLQSLDLSKNKIKYIRSLANLTGLQSINLSGNQINDISCLANHTGVRTLDLSRNQISNINFLANLPKLHYLNLSGNQISDIKPFFPLIKRGIPIKLRGGGGIFIAENPITSPTLSIVEKGTQAILNWFEQIQQHGEEPLFEAKLMILGQGGAGKTTFAQL